MRFFRTPRQEPTPTDPYGRMFESFGDSVPDFIGVLVDGEFEAEDSARAAELGLGPAYRVSVWEGEAGDWWINAEGAIAASDADAFREEVARVEALFQAQGGSRPVWDVTGPVGDGPSYEARWDGERYVDPVVIHWDGRSWVTRPGDLKDFPAAFHPPDEGEQT
jgi:hypothetical protein